MVDFVLTPMLEKVSKKTLDKLEPYQYHNYDHSCNIKYAKFLKKPLKLDMFVACDNEGNILEEPKCDCETEYDREGCSEKCWHYINQKNKVLFEGFEFTESQKFSTINKIKNSVHWYTKDRLYLTTKKEDGYHTYFQLFTIEDLIQCDVILTESAIKQLGL